VKGKNDGERFNLNVAASSSDSLPTRQVQMYNAAIPLAIGPLL